jgi:hypothetical protein
MKWAAWMALVSAVACSKPAADAAHSDAGAAAPVASAALADAQAEAPPPAKGATVTWTGTYKSSAGKLYIPEDWKSVHWNVPDTPAGLGEGTLSLTVDGATGRVSGTLAGPLGPATLAGIAGDGKLSATVARQDASDRGFAGTLQGSFSGDHGEGTIQVSLAEVSAVRSATFSLSKSGEGAAPPPR